MTEITTFFTVGHSTRTAGELVEIIREHGVELLVDVRRHPGSRRHPQFNREALAATLEQAGIAYRHEEVLGGRRGPVDEADSPAYAAWRSGGFRAYARHMNGAEARRAMDRLEDAGRRRRTGVMCAEADPRRCHRRIVADHLVARGHEVVHLLEVDRVERHRLSETARAHDDGRVTYPVRQGELFEGE